MNYFGGHVSLSEWARTAKVARADRLIQEDSGKRERLRLFNAISGLPIVKSTVFSWDDIYERTTNFNAFLRSIPENSRFALRLNPITEGYAVIRNRNLPLQALVQWATELTIDHSKYSYDFEPHVDSIQAAIVVVSASSIAGEMANSSILDLNSGLNQDVSAVVFRSQVETPEFDGPSRELTDFGKRVLDFMAVREDANRTRLKSELSVEFNGRYARGYYEAIGDSDGMVYFIDYNRALDADIDVAAPADLHCRNDELVLSGQPGCSGHAIGPARVITEVDSDPESFNAGDVLVCRFTTPDLLPWMVKASGIVTDVGGILSHAAIIARELKKPCVVGTRTATVQIHDGDIMEVRATEGVVIRRAGNPQ